MTEVSLFPSLRKGGKGAKRVVDAILCIVVNAKALHDGRLQLADEQPSLADWVGLLSIFIFVSTFMFIFCLISNFMFVL